MVTSSPLVVTSNIFLSGPETTNKFPLHLSNAIPSASCITPGKRNERTRVPEGVTSKTVLATPSEMNRLPVVESKAISDGSVLPKARVEKLERAVSGSSGLTSNTIFLSSSGMNNVPVTVLNVTPVGSLVNFNVLYGLRTAPEGVSSNRLNPVKKDVSSTSESASHMDPFAGKKPKPAGSELPKVVVSIVLINVACWASAGIAAPSSNPMIPTPTIDSKILFLTYMMLFLLYGSPGHYVRPVFGRIIPRKRESTVSIDGRHTSGLHLRLETAIPGRTTSQESYAFIRQGFYV